MTLKFVDVASWKEADDKSDLAICKAYASEIEVVSADMIAKMIDADEVRDASSDRDGFWFTVSNEQRDRDGDRIKQNGIDWGNFRKNPVVPFAHDYGHFTGNKPIGKVVKVVRETVKAKKIRQTRMLKQFTTEAENPEGAMVERMVRGKFLRAASIGFIPKEFEIDEKQEGEDDNARVGYLIKRSEGLESSVVVVPSNPGALTGAKEAGIDLSPMVPMLQKQLDGEALLLVPRQLCEEAIKLIAPQRTIFDVTVRETHHSGAVEPVDPVTIEDPKPEKTEEPKTSGLDYELGIDGDTKLKLWIADDAAPEFLQMAKSRIEQTIQSREEPEQADDCVLIMEN